MTRPALIAAALLTAAPAGAGGWSAPVFDVPPPPLAARAAPALDPWAPYLAAGLLLLILAPDRDGGHHADPAGPVVPPDPVTPDPSPVPLPDPTGLLVGAISLLGLRKMWALAGARDRGETQAAGWA